jgi:HlyD family secretion protein
MDRVVETRKLSTRTKIAIGGTVLLALALAFWFFAPRGGSQTVASDRLTISQVRTGQFEDFIPLRARVTPLLTVYLDAIEGGRVEKVIAEDGASLAKGELIVELPNAELQLSTLARQTEVEQQINNMRSQELALAQTRLANERSLIDADLAATKARRQYEREQPLASKGFVSGKQFNDTRDQYQYEQQHIAVVRRGQTTDEKLQASQLAQLGERM